jgi:hypothetical protein
MKLSLTCLYPVFVSRRTGVNGNRRVCERGCDVMHAGILNFPEILSLLSVCKSI